ncbi:DUF1573 domain-containing protein [Planctomycetota bacterium]
MMTSSYVCRKRLSDGILRVCLCIPLGIGLIAGCQSSPTGDTVVTETEPEAPVINEVTNKTASTAAEPTNQPTPSSAAATPVIDPRVKSGTIAFKSVIFNYGDIAPFSVHQAKFEYENVGDEPLNILSVKKCCGAVTTLDKQQIPPGETGTLTVDYRTAGPGKFSKELSLQCSDPNQPSTRLVVTGTVIETLQWEPKRLKLFLNKENGGVRDLHIKAVDGQAFSIQKITVTGDCMSFDFEPNQPALEHKFSPKLDLEALQAMSPARGRVALTTDRKDYSTIIMYFDLLPNYVITPPQIFIFNADPTVKEKRKISVLDNYVQDTNEISFQITDITARGGAVQILDRKPIADGYQLIIEIVPPQPRANQSSFTDEITITLDNKATHKVVVRGFYKQKVLQEARKNASQ